MMSSLRPITENDREWIRSLWMKWWSTPFVVSKEGKIHHVEDMAGFIALQEDISIGLITYEIVNTECEITSLISLLEGRGVGTWLLQRLEVEAYKRGCQRIWVITTNDNIHALGWYQKRGYRLIAFYRDAMNTVRQLKPKLALQGMNEIPLRDMIELEKSLN